MRKSIRYVHGRATFVCVGLCLLLAGCHWLRYHDLLATHVELMEGMARDTAEALEAGLYDPRASEIERLRYPLLRAQQFAEVSADWDGTERSGAAFRSFVDAYEAFVEVVDRTRIDGIEPAEEEEILSSVKVVTARGTRVLACIECERNEAAERCAACVTGEATARPRGTASRA